MPEPTTDSTDPAESIDSTGSTAVGRRSARARLWHALWHPGRAQWMIALVLCIMATGIVVQVRSTSEDQDYTHTRREDLVRLLDGLNQESRRLDDEIAELERTRTELETGSDAREVARAEAQRRADALAILTGTVPAHGSGVRIVIEDIEGQVEAQMILNAIQELRDAGAEAIEINDTIRVVESTWFGGASGAVTANEEPIGTHIVIDVIGDPTALTEAIRFRGGVESTVTAPDVGARIHVDNAEEIRVTATAPAREPEHARPAR